MHAVQRGWLYHVAQHFNRVVGHDANVAQLIFADAFEQSPDPGFVHFAAQKSGVGQYSSDVRGGLAHAKSDLEHQRGLGQLGTKRRFSVKRVRLMRQDELGSPDLLGFGLTRGDAACAPNKAANGARMFDPWRGMISAAHEFTSGPRPSL